MANIRETISEVGKLNPELARQIKKYVKDHTYGLVFENNLPEAVRLYKKSICTGDVVNILPPRGEFEKEENHIPWVVKNIEESIATIQHNNETKKINVEDLVSTLSYRDIIYPGLREIDRIERGDPDDPYHMVINAENYHALEALTYAYAGKVDCIYIDPPYNKPNARDWKYNCNYVDANDQYRHSKWLNFMERRLKLARQLLNPSCSALIVTIDEVEFMRLGLLLEQVFPDAVIQMVSTVNAHSPASRLNEFTRNNEYIFFVMIGNYTLNAIFDSNSFDEGDVVNWRTLRRGDVASRRGSSKGGTAQFFPIYVDIKTKKIVKLGEAITPDISIDNVPDIPGCEKVFPIRDDGMEMNWGLTAETLQHRLDKGYVRARGPYPKKPQKYSIQYLQPASIRSIEEGSVKIQGYEEDGSVIAVYDTKRKVLPKTQWDQSEYDGRDYGTKILNNIIGDRFDFPKSVYAVMDCIKLFVAEKKDALIVDFFAGSATTLHAVNLLNAEDEGHRRCICITNNEVSAEEEKKFIKKGLRPYDLEWEKYGIAHYIAWPRTKCTIEGVDVNGKPLKGDYGCDNEEYQEYNEEVFIRDTDKKVPKKLYMKTKQKTYPKLAEIKMSDGFKANAIFCELTYESAWPIRLDNAFDAIAPILWMQSGCHGPIIRKIGKSYLTTDYYGVLFDYNQASKFCEKVKNTPSIKTVFVVTDDQRRYSNMCRRLPEIEVHRLYETYLRTFEIGGEGGLD